MRGIATPSRPAAIAEAVGAIAGREPCSDAERRAAKAVAAELRVRDRRPRQRSVWVRLQRPAATGLAMALGVVGSVVSVDAPEVGAAFVAAALVAHLTRVLERLWARRATEVVEAPAAPGAAVELVLVAGAAAPAPALRDRVPWPALWELLALVGVLAAAGARIGGAEGTVIGALQLAPTLVLLVAAWLAFDAVAARPLRGPDGAADVEALFHVHDALAEEPPRRLRTTVVVAGPEAFAQWVGERRAEGTRPEEVCVLALGPAATGDARWWKREGRLLQLGYHPALREHARATGERSTATGTVSAARVARGARWPALRVGGDAEPAAELALAIVRRLDDELAAKRT